MSIALTVMICWIIADFLTGIFHWAEDTWVTPKTRLIGGVIGVHNVEHHRNPGLMARMGTWITRNVASVVIAVSALLIFWIFGIFDWRIVLVASFAALGNEVHEWNHRVKPKNAFVAFIQDSGLVQSKQQHAIHHKRPHDKYYCVLGNLTNAVLERVNFWRKLEWFCMTVLRMKMKRLSPERDGH
jgi:ubiquitin-conjugating enzyme E2 variant